MSSGAVYTTPVTSSTCTLSMGEGQYPRDCEDTEWRAASTGRGETRYKCNVFIIKFYDYDKKKKELRATIVSTLRLRKCHSKIR